MRLNFFAACTNNNADMLWIERINSVKNMADK
jgi:hypothetical protein